MSISVDSKLSAMANSPTPSDQATLQVNSAIAVLIELSNCNSTGCFSVSSGTADWCVYLDDGLIGYAKNSTHTRSQLNFKLRALGPIGNDAAAALAEFPDNYESIELLITELLRNKILTPQQVSKLALDFTKESFETLFWLEKPTFDWKPGETVEAFQSRPNIQFSKINLWKAIEYYRKRLVQWQEIHYAIKSPYERPYLFDIQGCSLRALKTERCPQNYTRALPNSLRG